MRIGPTYSDLAKDEPGVFVLQSLGRERYARLSWRSVEVSERVPLHYWKMSDSAKEMETRRITAALIVKIKRVLGSAPPKIVGAEDLN